MIIAGLKLTVLGMGVTFLFLVILVLLIKISYFILAARNAKELTEIEAAECKKRKKTALAEEKLVAAIIGAAIATHRSRAQRL
jgi:sodium pump decarboxylase gamma subunit